MRSLLKLVLLFIPLTLIGMLAIYLQGRPGQVAMSWGNYEIETSVTFVLITGLFLTLLFAGFWRALTWLKNWPKRMKMARLAGKKLDADYAVARGMLALAGGLGGEAEVEAQRARKALPKATLPLMLSAQAARLSGDVQGEEKYYRKLVEGVRGEEKETDAQLVGLRGLFHLSLSHGAVDDAALHAERALGLTRLTKNKRRGDWALEGLFQIEAYKGNWREARHLLDKLVKAGGVEKKIVHRRRAVLMLAEAQELAREETAATQTKAIELCQRALRLSPDFVPAYGLVAQLLAHAGQTQRKKWARRLEKLWRKHPHPDIAKAYLALYPGRTALQKLTAIQKLTSSNQQTNESRFALAQAAIKAQRWSLARLALEVESGDKQPPDAMQTQKYCRLMADIERGEHEDEGAARAWMDRAMTAAPDTSWVGPAGATQEWQAVCRKTGAFDAYEWRKPLEFLGAPLSPSSTALTSID